MMKIGRNDPCPCGSGKKFKKCCMREDIVTSSKELHYRRLSEAYDRLFERLGMYAEVAMGKSATQAALREYLLLDPGMEPEEETLQRQIPLFLPWFFFNWENGSRSGLKARGKGRTVAELYAEDKGHLLGELDRRIIDAVNRTPYTFYEVLTAESGKGIHMQEVFMGQEISVEERRGSSYVKPGDVVFGRAVVVDDVGMIVGLSTHIIPPRYKPGLLEFRKRMGKNRPLTCEFLRKWEPEIRKVYLEIDRSLFTPPQLCNTDGDPLEFHKLVYEIDSAEDAFAQLAPLCVTETAGDLRHSAEKGPDGRIVRAEIFWNREGHKMSAAMTNTLLGNILIEPRRLTVTVNSLGRAKTIREEIESRLAKGARFRLDEIQDTRAMLGEFSQQSFGPGIPADEDALMQNPEVRRQVVEVIKKHWEGWADTKIPALGGRTPRRMVKTKDGREAVEALLADAERGAADAVTNAANLEGILHVREILGLTKRPVTDE
jgi:hypothetical protein